MYTSKQLIMMLFFTVLIAGSVGFFAANKINKISVNFGNKNITDVNLTPGLEAAYNRLLLNGRADIAIPGYGYQPTKIISGIINEVKDDKVFLEVKPMNVLADPALKNRIVQINNVKIYKQVLKTPEELAKNSEEMRKEMEVRKQSASSTEKQVRSGPINTPGFLSTEPIDTSELYNKQEIKPADLKVGDQIMITAKDDIHAAKEFTASEITVTF